MAGQRNSYGKRSHSQSDYSENGGNKRRNSGDDREHFVIDPEDTVYRYLCRGKKIGSIIGRGGEIVKHLRVDTKSMIRIGQTVPGSEERVVTISSTSEETNSFEEGSNVCPAQDSLFRVLESVVAEDFHADEDTEQEVTVNQWVWRGGAADGVGHNDLVTHLEILRKKAKIRGSGEWDESLEKRLKVKMEMKVVVVERQ